jgi:alkylhydroperoxidase family enzyme
MARIDLPDGDLPEIARVWALAPELGKAVGELSAAVYERSMLAARVKEAVRMRIALINDCPV